MPGVLDETVEEAVWNARRAHLRHKIMYELLKELREGMSRELVEDCVHEALKQTFRGWEVKK